MNGSRVEETRLQSEEPWAQARQEGVSQQPTLSHDDLKTAVELIDATDQLFQRLQNKFTNSSTLRRKRLLQLFCFRKVHVSQIFLSCLEQRADPRQQ